MWDLDEPFLSLASLENGQFRYLPQCFGLGSRVTHKCAKGRGTNAINWMTKVKEESRKNWRKWWILDWDAEWSGKYSCDGNPRERFCEGCTRERWPRENGEKRRGDKIEYTRIEKRKRGEQKKMRWSSGGGNSPSKKKRLPRLRLRAGFGGLGTHSPPGRTRYRVYIEVIEMIKRYSLNISFWSKLSISNQFPKFVLLEPTRVDVRMLTSMISTLPSSIKRSFGN